MLIVSEGDSKDCVDIAVGVSPGPNTFKRLKNLSQRDSLLFPSYLLFLLLSLIFRAFFIQSLNASGKQKWSHRLWPLNKACLLSCLSSLSSLIPLFLFASISQSERRFHLPFNWISKVWSIHDLHNNETFLIRAKALNVVYCQPHSPITPIQCQSTGYYTARALVWAHYQSTTSTGYCMG